MDAKALVHYVRMMRLILLLSALLSAIAGYTPAAAARPVVAGQVLCVAQPAQIAAARRPANIIVRPALVVMSDAVPMAADRPLYADRLLI